MLPLWRPVLASTVRIPTVQRPIWYARNASQKTPYNIPGSGKPSARSPPGKSQKTDQQKEYSADQAEFDTNADPQRNTSETVR